MNRDEWFETAKAESTTPFDYIIVGSGAGGGPLACRLALAKKHVLLIEAGGDPAKAKSDTFPNAQAGEVHNAPGYMASSSEDLEMSWQYSVRHYEDTSRQINDQKYDPSRDTDGTGGVFYPRSSGLGGCTGHHAMIVVRPNDRDWNHIAELTNDDSWSASNMQPLFAKFENCLYLKEYRGLLPAVFDGIFLIWRAIVKFFTPRAVLDRGGHGTKGWQPTSLISQQLLRRVVKTDPLFTRLLLTSAFAGIERSNRLIAWLKQLIVTFGAVRQFDPNDNLTRERNPEGGVYLVPMGTGGDSDLKDERGETLKGRRTGVREFLLKTQQDNPAYLQIESDLHVTEIIFDTATPPNAIGVKAKAGRHLYRASPKSTDAARDGTSFELYAKSEIILCCGTFNTPQLLMLSGIGDRDELNRHHITCRVHLPGIGRNLQDRYEVGVISELKQDFSILNRVSYLPGDPNDPERAMWIEKKEGLYSINGGTVVLLQRSTQADGPEPDLFSFGVPAAFRGYYWNWSRELFRPTKGAPVDQHNLWSWVILKAYTRNNGGRVRLRSDCAFDTPDICFHSFDEGGIEDWEKDVAALEEAVMAIQGVNEQSRLLFGDELQPGRYLKDKNLQQTASNKPEWSLAEWIKNEAWGHHACGTCRIGSDQWQADTANLIDTSAVLDSRFHVHGVKGLRVVDASIFPKIPGYFILAAIFMASEKAALTILEDSNDVNYPGTIRAIEAKAVEKRRTVALVSNDTSNLTGLALSGGGIRSAAFSLGVLQALAGKNKLRHVDFLSTVSGGGFTGGFLGRLFHSRRVTSSADPCGRVQDILQSNQSTPMKWLRDNANYLFASGSTDYQFGAGIFVRNIMALYLFIGIFFLAICGSLVGISRIPCIANLLPRFQDIAGSQDLLGPANWWAQYVSVWWWLPAAMLVLVVIPMSLGFWLAPKQRSIRPTPPYALAAWVVLLVATSIILAWMRIWIIPASLLGALGLAWVWQELARRSIRHVSDVEKNNLGELVRNALARGLGESLFILLFLTVWVVVDTAAGLLVSLNLSTTVMRVLAPAIPFAIMLYSWAHNLLSMKLSKFASVIVGLVGVVIALALLIVVDMTAYRIFQTDVPSPWLIVALAVLFSVIVGRAFDFLNYSSWHLPYAARIRRCFLGASNDDRFDGKDRIDVDVQVSEAGDDLPHQQYRPENRGGPLHLISVCINDTIEYSSQRKLLARRGSLMTIGTFGISVGRRYFANWVKAVSQPKWLAFRRWLDGTNDGDDPPPALSAIPLNAAPDTFHPFARRDERSAAVEGLSLGSWLAISGAAFSTGQGRATSTFQSLLLGLANVRLGYWWDSGIKASERAGQFPANLWRRLKQLPGSIFHTQWLLLSEWFGRFSGPSTELWNLSDGGHVESTALYELVRRRLPLIICSDATADLDYTYPALSQLVRMIRIDFGAELEWGIPSPVPPILANWINVGEYGSLTDLGGSTAHGGPGTKNAAVAKIKYADGASSWLVYLKPSLIQTESLDVQSVAKTNPDFPQDATLNQFFDEKLWESYRILGFDIVNRAFR